MPQQITTLDYSETLNAMLETVATIRQYVVDLDWGATTVREYHRGWQNVIELSQATSLPAVHQIIAISYQDNTTAIQVSTRRYTSRSMQNGAWYAIHGWTENNDEIWLQFRLPKAT
jgi:hypothetical protein